MIKFTCPGCKVAHTANEAFADRRAKCVRCGASLYIPQQDGEATFAPYGTLPRGSGPNSGDAGAGSPSGTSPQSGQSGEGPQRKRINRNAMLVILLLLLVVLGVIVYFLFFQKPTEPTKKAPPPPPSEAPPPEPEQPYEFVGPIYTPPPPPPPPVPIVLNADRLLLELLGREKEFDARYRGKLVEIRGNCGIPPSPNSSWLTFQYPYYVIEGGGNNANKVRISLPNHFPKFPEAPLPAKAVLGGMSSVSIAGSPYQPQGGRPVTVRGWYAGHGELHQAEVVSVFAPADSRYREKRISVTGVSKFSGGFIEFKQNTQTNLKVGVVCKFTESASKVAQRLIPDARLVTVTGTCVGRLGTGVVLENCVVGDGGEVEVEAMKLMADYEVDLLPVQPIEPARSILKVTATNLAKEYQSNPTGSDEKYSDCILELTGYVLRRDGENRTIRFETSTDTAVVVVEAKFVQEEYALIPADEETVTVRGEFRGTLFTQSPSNLVLENARYYDPAANDPTPYKITPDFFPLKPGRTWEVVRVSYPEPPKTVVKPKPGDKPKSAEKPDDKPADPKPVEVPVQRVRMATLPNGTMVGGILQKGTFTGKSLFAADAPEIKWLVPVTRPKPNTPLTPADGTFAQYRVTDRFVEMAVPKPPPDKDAPPPKADEPKVLWVPLLRLHATAGKSWQYEAGGLTVVTKVEKFDTDDQKRDRVTLVAVATTADKPSERLETTVTLVRGVGETSRVVKWKTKTEERIVSEQRLEGEPVEPKTMTVPGAVLGGTVEVSGPMLVGELSAPKKEDVSNPKGSIPPPDGAPGEVRPGKDRSKEAAGAVLGGVAEVRPLPK